MEQALMSRPIEVLPRKRGAEPLRWVRSRELGSAPSPWGVRQIWTIQRRPR